MKKLKIVLQFNNVLLLVLLAIFIIRYISYNQNDHLNDVSINGKVIEYKKNKYKTNIVIKTNNNEKVLVGINNKINCNIAYGNSMDFKGRYSQINSNTIPNNFNYKKYLKSKKIFNYFNADSCKKLGGFSNLYKIKNYIYKRINRLKSNSYLNAILLGNKALLTEEEYNSLKDNNIMHLFAISGMHISFLIGILDLILKRFHNNIKSLICVLIVFFYAFLVGFLASILRVLTYIVIDYICNILKINISKIKKLIMCCLLLLIYNPFFLFDLGFIYSFLLMFFIYLYNFSGHNKFKSYFKMILLTFLVSAPITIYNFYHLNFLALLTNIIFIPLISMFLFPISILTIFIPFLDNILLFLFSYFMKVSILFSKLQLFNIVIAKPSVLLLLIYYILLIVNNYKKSYFKIILISFIFYLNNFINLTYKIVFLDVGQGDSSLIISPYNRNVTMIDTGGIAYSNYHISNNIITYLNSLGISKIHTLIITHGYFDHMGEAINIVNNIKVEKVVFNCGDFNDLEKSLIKILNKKRVEYYSCVDRLDNLYFLQTKIYDNENDNSNVIYTEINDFKFMLMGDAGKEKEKDIIDKYNISNIDVLKVGHHGSKTSSSELFIKKMNPKYSIISVGKNNRYGHPNKEVLNSLSDSKVYRTDEDGTIVLSPNLK